MKSKYDAIVKVKKQRVDKIERDLKKINASIDMLKEEIRKKEEEFNSFSFPLKGNFALISQIKLQQHLLQEEIELLKSQVSMLNSRREDLLNELKKAKLEYEKMKYLQAEEIKEALKKQRVKENQLMDEIALVLENFKENR